MTYRELIIFFHGNEPERTTIARRGPPLNSTIVKWGTVQMAIHWHATHLFMCKTKHFGLGGNIVFLIYVSHPRVNDNVKKEAYRMHGSVIVSH